MDNDECYAFGKRFTREKCEKLYCCLPDINFPKGLRLIWNELDYAAFIAIAYEYVELTMCVDHFGNTNMK